LAEIKVGFGFGFAASPLFFIFGDKIRELGVACMDT
jgi:hypothetical protein